MEENKILSVYSSIIKEEKEASPLFLVSSLIMREEKVVLGDQGQQGNWFGHSTQLMPQHLVDIQTVFERTLAKRGIKVLCRWHAKLLLA